VRGVLEAVGRVERGLDVVVEGVAGVAAVRGGDVGLGEDIVDSMQLLAAVQQALWHERDPTFEVEC
jgi:hypothetical protein